MINKYLHPPAEELYDLSQDPDEQTNRAADAESQGELQRLRREMDGWMQSLGDQGSATEMALKPVEKPIAATPDP